jgi:glutamine synthetase
MTSVQTRSIDEIVAKATSADVQLARFLYCDTSSIIRGKSVHVNHLEKTVKQGIGLVKGMMAMNLLDQLQLETGLGAVGEVRLVPDLNTFVILPFCRSQAAFICDMQELDQSPWRLCPRAALKKQIARAASMDIHFQAAFEPEFTLFAADGDAPKPIDTSLCFSTEGMNRASHFISSLVDALCQQGIDVAQYYPELGHGQHELSITHKDALAACDQHIIYRETLRGIALAQGVVASLAPKPLLDQAGNGCHLHLSAWSPGFERNLFWLEDGENNFSPLGRQFVAGILNHLPALVALTCASVNSYRRLQPRSWSSAYTCWGFENREAAVRVPSLYWGAEEHSANIELKCVDASCNPYLALAAVIACGLDGIERKLTPPSPIAEDPSSLSSDVQKAKQICRLPQNLMEALVELDKDEYLMRELGELLLRTFLIVKSSEVSAFARDDEAFELSHHLNKF